MNKKKNSSTEPPKVVETELVFEGGLTRAMMSGTLRTTIRLGKRYFAADVMIHGKKARVQNYRHTTLLHADFEILTRNGYKNMFLTLMSLRKHYPEIDLNSTITIIQYRITELL